MNEVHDRIGKLADQIDSLCAALRLPLPAEIHVSALRETLPSLRDEARECYVALTGEDPWSE